MGLMRELLCGRGWRYRGCHGGAPCRYGYPAFGAAEPNVVAQFLFEEAGSVGHTSLVDEVSSITVPAVGSPVYGMGASGRHKQLAPGIQSGEFDGFLLTTPVPSMAPGTGAFTREFWVAGFPTILFSSTDVDDPDSKGEFYLFFMYAGTPTLIVQTVSDDGLGIFSQFFTIPDIIDNGLHKIRVSATRTGGAGSLMTVEVDTIQQGPAVDFSAMDGKTIATSLVRFGSCGIAGSASVSRFYEARFSNNATNNSTPVV